MHDVSAFYRTRVFGGVHRRDWADARAVSDASAAATTVNCSQVNVVDLVGVCTYRPRYKSNERRGWYSKGGSRCD